MAASEALPAGPLAAGELRLIDGWWRAANYLSVGQIYLLDNPLLREPLAAEDVKPRLLGHWGTTPGLNLLWAHLNRVIRARDLDVLYVTGPGHGGPGVVANAYLEGTYSELYAQIGRDERGLQRLFRQFSFPGGIPSHAAPETPGSIHEGGELGYALAHAFGAAFDNPGLTVACVIGDGEAETGPLAASWHANKFLNPRVTARCCRSCTSTATRSRTRPCSRASPSTSCGALLTGYGWRPLMVSGGFDGEDPARVHQLLAETLDEAFDEIARIQEAARDGELAERPTWPMIVLRTPRAGRVPRRSTACPSRAPGARIRCRSRRPAENDEHRRLLEGWMRSYRPEELFDEPGALVPEIAALAPAGERRMSANPHANGGALLRDLILPDFPDYAVEVAATGPARSEATRVLGAFLRDVIAQNPDNFRIVGPDETTSNRLTAVFETTTRAWLGERAATDEGLGPDGRVMEVLSEHLCQGWLEGYLLTGRHGLFNCYEAFIHIVDSMFNQHAKWLKTSRRIPWRRPLASLNYLLTSHVWQQDHNGFSHQDPGFIDHVDEQEGRGHPRLSAARHQLPPVGHGSLPAQPQLRQCRRRRQAACAHVSHDRRGDRRTARAASGSGSGHRTTTGTSQTSSWPVAATCRRSRRSPRSRCCGSICRSCGSAWSTSSTSCASSRTASIRTACPMRSSTRSSRVDRPVVFAYHGYPWLIHRLTYSRANHDNFHVRGYKEEGTTTTPFDMVMLNDLDRFHLVMDVIDRVPGLAEIAAHLRQDMQDERLSCRAHTREHGEDRPDVAGWTWPRERLSSILVVNAGSTSLKLSAVDGREQSRELDALDEAPGDVVAVGHRVVHGGARFRAPVLLDGETLAELRSLAELAPLHNTPALAAIDDARAAFPGLPHVAVFDTEFHATMPEEASTYAVPEHWRTQWHIRRYGFHGLSVQWAAEQVRGPSA